MGTVNIIDALKAIIPEAIEVANKDITEKGVYIYFNGFQSSDNGKDIVAIQLIIVGDSLTGKEFPVLEKIKEIRSRLENEKEIFIGAGIFKSVEPIISKNTLFIYVINLNIEVYNEILQS